MDALRRVCHVPLVQQGLEGNPKLQVGVSELHRARTFHSKDASINKGSN
jgi:hypothetical protein